MVTTRTILSAAIMLVLLSQSAWAEDKGSNNVSGDVGPVLDLDFESAKAGLIPVKPDQVVDFKKDFDNVLGAVNGQPMDISRVSQTVVLEPGAAIPVLDMSPGYVSAIRFIDAHGEPWPVTSNSVGNPNWFSLVKPEGLEPGNILTVSSLAPKAHSNLFVTLQGMNSPIFISIRTTDITGAKKASGSVTYQLSGISPLSPPPIYNESIDILTDDIMSFLNATPPKGSVKQTVSQKGVTAWKFGDQLYVRTTRDLIWPAWNETASSGDINVYRMSIVPLLIVSDAAQGRINVEIN